MRRPPRRRRKRPSARSLQRCSDPLDLALGLSLSQIPGKHVKRERLAMLRALGPGQGQFSNSRVSNPDEMAGGPTNRRLRVILEFLSSAKDRFVFGD